MKVFLDANILFSAGDEKSVTGRLLCLLSNHAQVVTCPHAWEEARRNLALKRPQCLPEFEKLSRFVTVTHTFHLPGDIEIAEKDKPILAGAVGASCSHLWTSDRLHFGALYGRTIHGVLVVSSIQLADALQKLYGPDSLHSGS